MTKPKIYTKRFYVYALCHPDGTPFYIGKGNGRRVHSHESMARSGGKDRKSRTIRGVWEAGDEIVKKLLFESDDEQEAYAEEARQISKFQDTLVNQHPGGKGKVTAGESHPFHIWLPREPVDLWDKLKRLASSKRRTIKQEVMLALESHLKSNGVLSDAEIKKLNP